MKVKCDEIRPVCGNCTRRFVDNTQPCEYAGAPPRRSAALSQEKQRLVPHPDDRAAASAASLQRNVNPPTAVIRPNPSAHPAALSPEPSRWRTLELRLMHHYASVTSRTLPDCNGQAAERMWQRIVPRLAFSSEVVLNPLLALTALHLHGRDPSCDAALPLAVERYLGRSLADHRAALHSADDEPVWVSAVLLSVLYWLLAHQRRPGEPYELPLQAWAMLSGVTALYARRRRALGRLGYEWYGDRHAPLLIEDRELPDKSQRQLDLLEDDLLELFARFGVGEEEQDEEKLAYHAARRHIVSYYRAYFSGIHERNLRLLVCTMPVYAPPAFRRMLEKHDPLAMALVARLQVLLVGVESVWWMDGEGDYEVLHRDIDGICGIMPAELKWCMEWPCRVLSGEIVLEQ
ncbi:hypothetical protein KJ359_004488 [Pestalotiopsis sp. 9143b]|nr:hypothetical protein KJ359_004488 [Pestalotiopsis sp. 9143b]